MGKLFAFFVAFVMMAVWGAAPASAQAAQPAANDWDKPRPYTAKVETGRTHTLFYPERIADSDRKHPVILWGNGLSAVPAHYSGLLRHWATHGFIVAADNTPTSTSVSMLAAIDQLKARNETRDDILYGKVDLQHIGTSGHSHGGAGAINAAADQRVDTTAPMQPGPLASTRKLRGPMLLLAGEKDLVVPPMDSPRSWLSVLFENASHVPAVYAELGGADHTTPTGTGGGYRGATTAWFLHFLMDDQQARSEFFGDECGLCTDPAWVKVLRNERARQLASSRDAVVPAA